MNSVCSHFNQNKKVWCYLWQPSQNNTHTNYEPLQ